MQHEIGYDAFVRIKDIGGPGGAAQKATAGTGRQRPPKGGNMLTQERIYSISLFAALAMAVVITFVALLRGYAHLEMLW
jgi:hypothetical protein